MRGDRILLARRSETRTFYPGVWDVIGGHCEARYHILPLAHPVYPELFHAALRHRVGAPRR